MKRKRLVINLVFFVMGVLTGLAIGVRTIKTTKTITTTYEALPGSIWAKAGMPVVKAPSVSVFADLMRKLKKGGYKIKKISPYKYVWTIKKKK